MTQRGSNSSPDDGSKDVFVHFSSIKSEGIKTLTKNQKVEFDIFLGDKGPTAENVITI